LYISDPFRPFEYFKTDNVTDQIAHLRHQHYERKRKEKVALIVSTIKQGVLPEL